ncbi:hypothetical protein Q5424_28025 [Conexibacter sp. JD483]|uniref:hypothetical protein n=1 Tax=unclassified Conexibacter TaxID=2627773 RepID=UPI002720EC6A|nr:MULTISPECIES: hypothetical protein [unclassified Conexibacter]MDO8187244.1 hypothetical protein [Conexibacter sp. CPCC 205706]MDO8199341.1 hypothetical protein [Conexibacter sp. CPCC 205762]MDR9372980.1 hypothetical protein [Conexibacter sp. JD483]
MARSAVLGLPRIGPDRELKFALESHWAGRTDAATLHATARGLRGASWRSAQAAGLDTIPSGDFSLYDQVLDTAWALGVVPPRYGAPDRGDLGQYFALARGDDARRPLELTKWFDTNYHHLVPELTADQAFALDPRHWVGQFEEALALGVRTRPVAIGPFTFLSLSKGIDRPLDLLPRLAPVYGELIGALARAGARELQIDEPALVRDHARGDLDAFAAAWRTLADAAREHGVELTLATYFAGLDAVGALEPAIALRPDELHLDLVRAPEQLEPALAALAALDADPAGHAPSGERPARTRLSLGVVDGRNVWATDLDAALALVDRATTALGGERVTVAAS